MTKPYVYRVEHIVTGKYYFGYRFKNKVAPKEDFGIKYFTSAKYINKNNWHEYHVEILSVYDTEDDAFITEQNLIWACWSDPLLLNKMVQRPDRRHFKRMGRRLIREKSIQRKPGQKCKD